MKTTATIYVHPEMCHNPLDLAALEFETGRKVVTWRRGFKLVSKTHDQTECAHQPALPEYLAGDAA